MDKFCKKCLSSVSNMGGDGRRMHPEYLYCSKCQRGYKHYDCYTHRKMRNRKISELFNGLAF